MFLDLQPSKGSVSYGSSKGKIIGVGKIGLPKISQKSQLLCESCQKGKQLKASFKSKNVVSTSRPLELLHIDLFGPTRTPSLAGKKYGLVIVDDYSRFTWVHFLAHKHESYKAFEIFSKHVQNEKGF